MCFPPLLRFLRRKPKSRAPIGSPTSSTSLLLPPADIAETDSIDTDAPSTRPSSALINADRDSARETGVPPEPLREALGKNSHDTPTAPKTETLVCSPTIRLGCSDSIRNSTRGRAGIVESSGLAIERSNGNSSGKPASTSVRINEEIHGDSASPTTLIPSFPAAESRNATKASEYSFASPPSSVLAAKSDDKIRHDMESLLGIEDLPLARKQEHARYMLIRGQYRLVKPPDELKRVTLCSRSRHVDVGPPEYGRQK
ncbi:hypothetical protein K440DRAFT_664972 [Wilcoxina mikolae CBS 423.85]|nr:hypothetical protein K440DRAFT_664972 [Wilcoxina mikolae CBS 423.85]